METDEMELDTIGDRKTALFVIISDKMCIRDRDPAVGAALPEGGSNHAGWRAGCGRGRAL